MQFIQFGKECFYGSMVSIYRGIVGSTAVIGIADFGCMFILVVVVCVAFVIIAARGAAVAIGMLIVVAIILTVAVVMVVVVAIVAVMVVVDWCSIGG